MKNKKSISQLGIWIGCLILFSATLGFATNSHVLKTQGLINSGGNLKAGYLLINEMKIYIDKTTKVMDHRERNIPITEFQTKKWVYMEIEKDPDKKTIHARKIYLLPHYVPQEGKRKFSFMK
jgi:hypothetical protein